MTYLLIHLLLSVISFSLMCYNITNSYELVFQFKKQETIIVILLNVIVPYVTVFVHIFLLISKKYEREEFLKDYPLNNNTREGLSNKELNFLVKKDFKTLLALRSRLMDQAYDYD